MKKIIIMLLSAILMLSLFACAGAPESNAPAVETPETATATPAPTTEQQSTQAPELETEPESEPSDANALIVYFSWSGNTEAVATEIQAQTGADIFEIVPAEPYTDDYNTLLDIAQEEKQSAARPAISGGVEDMQGYDMIYLGYPNWWSDMPMVIYSFLDDYDLSGKTIAPFCTSGGSGFSGTVSAIQELEPDAVVTEGLHIGSSSASEPADAVAAWLGELASE